MQKFGKPFGNVSFRSAEHQKGNKSQLLKSVKINSIYSQGPKRTNCKVCKTSIAQTAWFQSFGIKYFLCENCKHLNGEFEETSEFAIDLYSNSETSTYDDNYNSNFNDRVTNIYSPKIDFLLESINLPASELRLLDFGCGGGHLLKAAKEKGLECFGVETNAKLVDLASENLGANCVTRIDGISEFDRSVKWFQPNVVSFIGVLEHLVDMDEVLQICKNQGVEFIYTSVPTFSLTSLLQGVNEQVFPRHLSGGHTHLFSRDSLLGMFINNSYTVFAEWWFGSDIPDLLRTIAISYEDKSYKLDNFLDLALRAQLDSLQKVLDESTFSSEVHAVAKISKNK